MAEEADYLTQLTGGSSGFNAMLASNSDDSPPKKSPKSDQDKEFHGNIAGDIGKLESDEAKLGKILESDEALKPPHMKEAPKPEDYQTDPMQKFGSAGSVIATLGSLFTRKKMTNSFNSLAAVNNSISQGDASKFKEAYDTWKVDNENAIKMAEWDQKHLDSLADRVKDGEKGAIEEARLHGIMTERPSLKQAAEMGDIESLRLTNKQKLLDMAEHSKSIDDRTQFALAKIDDAAAKKGTPLTPQETIEAKVSADKEFDAKPSAKTAGEGLTDEQYEKYKNDPGMQPALKAYMHSGSTAMALGSAGNRGSSYQEKAAALRRMAQEKDPDFDPAMASFKYAGYKKELATVETQNGKISLASNILDSSIPSLIEAAKKLNLGPSTSINSLYNAAKKQFNDTDFKNFSTQLRAATTDYAQFIGRGQGTVHSDEESLKILNENMNTSSLGGFKDAVTQERDNVQSGIDKTIADIDAKVSGKSSDSSKASGIAPEGTIIHNGNVTKKKVNGEWVTQ